MDIGAGIGDNARALARVSYKVTALSPDKKHVRYFNPLRQFGVEFHSTTFEEFDQDE